MINLKHLDLSDNDLESLPSEVNNLINLEELSCDMDYFALRKTLSDELNERLDEAHRRRVQSITAFRREGKPIIL